MYPFHTLIVAGFKLAYSSPDLTEKHLKRFVEEGVTPLNQATMNLYLSGEFRFEVGGAVQRLIAGQTSNDLVMTEFPVGVLCTEQPIVVGSRRLCVSADRPRRWSRVVITLDAGEAVAASDGGLVVVLAGRLSTQGRPLVAGDFATYGQVLIASGPAKVVVASWG